MDGEESRPLTQWSLWNVVFHWTSESFFWWRKTNGFRKISTWRQTITA